LPKVASYPAYQNLISRKNFTALFLKYKRLKLKLRQPTGENHQHRQDTTNIKMIGGNHHLFTEAIFKPE